MCESVRVCDGVVVLRACDGVDVLCVRVIMRACICDVRVYAMCVYIVPAPGR